MPLSFRTSLFAALMALGLSTTAIVPAFAGKTAADAPEFRPTSVAGGFLAGLLASSLRDDSAAAAFYGVALKGNPGNPDLINRTFIALVSAGEMDKAVVFARRMLAIDKNNPIAHLVLGVRALRARQYADARAHLQATADKPILQLATPLISTWTYAGAGQTKRGVQASDSIASDEGFSTFKNFSAGMMLDLAGSHDEAIARLKDAHDHDANAVTITDALARALARAGKKDEALAVLDAYNAKIPRQPVVAALAADIKAGKRIAPAAGSAQQGAADILISVAAAISKQGGADYAVVFYRLALYLDPNNAAALIGLAELYTDLKQPEIAEKLFEAVPDASPLKRNAEIELATVLDQLDRTDQAVDHLKKIIAKDPKDLDAIISLGGLYQSRKRWDEAAATFTQALDVIGTPTRNDWSTFYYRGIAYERTNQWPKAEADFKKALELYPDQPSVLNYLGYSWIDKGMHLQEGMEMIKKAVDQRPDDGYIVDSLGWAHYTLGEYDEAVEQLERAVSLKPGDPTINDHLGDAYWKDGRKLEATFQWHHALDSKPDPDEKAKIEQKLKQGLQDSAGAENGAKKVEAPKPAETPKATETAKPAPAVQPAPVSPDAGKVKEAPKPADAPNPATVPAKPDNVPAAPKSPEPLQPGTPDKAAPPAETPKPADAPKPDAVPPAAPSAPATAPTDPKPTDPKPADPKPAGPAAPAQPETPPKPAAPPNNTNG